MCCTVALVAMVVLSQGLAKPSVGSHGMACARVLPADVLCGPDPRSGTPFGERGDGAPCAGPAEGGGGVGGSRSKVFQNSSISGLDRWWHRETSPVTIKNFKDVNPQAARTVKDLNPPPKSPKTHVDKQKKNACP